MTTRDDLYAGARHAGVACGQLGAAAAHALGAWLVPPLRRRLAARSLEHAAAAMLHLGAAARAFGAVPVRPDLEGDAP